ncbi:MAG: hypothetical protein NTV94_06165 [Planctomycetota bacterium]|nr:hypothetical protein [Planctomycetota bacterium]
MFLTSRSAAAIVVVACAMTASHAGIILGEYSGRHAIGFGPSYDSMTESLDQTFNYPTTTTLSHQYPYVYRNWDDQDITSYFSATMRNTQSRSWGGNYIHLTQRGDFMLFNETNPRDDWGSVFRDFNFVTQKFWADYGDCGFLFYEQHSRHPGNYEVVGFVKNEATNEILGSVDFSDGPANLAIHVTGGWYSVTISRTTYSSMGIIPHWQDPYPAYAHSMVNVQWVPAPGPVAILACGLLAAGRRRR